MVYYFSNIEVFQLGFFLFFSSVVRRRATEDRKRNLADKVDEIKRKMKDSEKCDDSFSSSMIGLVLCLAVAGFLYFYYR